MAKKTGNYLKKPEQDCKNIWVVFTVSPETTSQQNKMLIIILTNRAINKIPREPLLILVV